MPAFSVWWNALLAEFVAGVRRYRQPLEAKSGMREDVSQEALTRDSLVGAQ
jgi:hypothetical protein